MRLYDLHANHSGKADLIGDFRLTENDGLLHLTISRPDKLNAINLDIWQALVSTTERLRDNHETRVLLVTAEGRYFSAGIDLNGALAPDPTLNQRPSDFRRWYRQGVGSLQWLGDEWEAIEKPIVVGFQGPALGGALELSLCADFRLATPHAQLGLPEIMLGALPGSGGTSRLVRLAGPHWARAELSTRTRCKRCRPGSAKVLERNRCHAAVVEGSAP